MSEERREPTREGPILAERTRRWLLETGVGTVTAFVTILVARSAGAQPTSCNPTNCNPGTCAPIGCPPVQGCVPTCAPPP